MKFLNLSIHKAIYENKTFVASYCPKFLYINPAYHHVLGGLHWLEPDEGDLHGEDGADDVDGGVGDVDPVREAAADHEDEDVHGDEVDEEHVAAPRGHHVEVGHGAEGRPVDVASLDALDPIDGLERK